MQMLQPTPEHGRLEKLAGRFSATETVHPSKWSETQTSAESHTEARLALDGFALVQDYEQRQADGSVYSGHGVFRYDPPSDTYELHWFDSTGEPLNLFRGGFENNVLTLTSRRGDGWMRLRYDFNLARGYRMHMETSEDGEHWQAVNEGENFRSRKAATGKRTVRRAGTKASGSKKTVAEKKTAASRSKPVTGTSAKKQPAAKKATKESPAKGARETTRQTTRKTTGKSTKKTAAGRAQTKKKATRRESARSRVPAAETRRRKASTATGKKGAKTGRKTTRAVGASAAQAGVSQQAGKGAARKAPRMQAAKKTSTRTGGSSTRAKGTRPRA